MPFDEQGNWIPPGGKWAKTDRQREKEERDNQERARQAENVKIAQTGVAPTPAAQRAQQASQMLERYKIQAPTAQPTTPAPAAAPAAGGDIFGGLMDTIRRISSNAGQNITAAAQDLGKSLNNVVRDAKAIQPPDVMGIQGAIRDKLANSSIVPGVKDQFAEGAFKSREELPEAGMTTAQKIGANVMAGVGDFTYSHGSIADMMGFKNLAADMKAGAQAAQAQGTTTPEFKGWKSFIDPEWLTSVLPRTATMSAGMAAEAVPLAVAGSAAGGTAAAALGLGRFGTTAMSFLGGAAASAPVEAAMEAGSVYEEIRSRGGSEEEAEAAAWKTFGGNAALTSLTNMGELASLFLPKGVGRFLSSLPSKTMLGAGSGFVEEGAQGLISQWSMGDDLSWDMEEAAIGGLLGGGMAFGGYAMDKVQQIAERVKSKLPPETQVEVAEALKDAAAQGIPEDEAMEEIMDALADDPAAQKLIEEAAKEVFQSEGTAALNAAKPDVDATAAQTLKPAETPKQTLEQPGPEELKTAEPLGLPDATPKPPKRAFMTQREVDALLKGDTVEYDRLTGMSPEEQDAEITAAAPVQPGPQAPVEPPQTDSTAAPEPTQPVAETQTAPVEPVMEQPTDPAAPSADWTPAVKDQVQLKKQKGIQFEITGPGPREGTFFATKVGAPGSNAMLRLQDIEPSGTPSDLTPEQQARKDVEDQYKKMKDDFATAGFVKPTTRLKKLQELRDFANANDLEFSDYHNELLQKFEEKSSEYKNRQRKNPGESWMDAAKRMSDNELRWELENMTGETLRKMRDELGIPKSNVHKNVVVSDIIKHLRDVSAPAEQSPVETQADAPFSYKVNKNHVALKANGKTYRFRHNNGFVAFRHSGMSVSDMYDLLGPDADIGEEMHLDSFVEELDKGLANPYKKPERPSYLKPLVTPSAPSVSDDRKQRIIDDLKELDGEIKTLQDSYAKAVNDQFEWLQDSLRNRAGVSQGYLIFDDDGNVVDRIGRISNNPKWYQDFFAKHNKAPNRKELWELAKKHVDEGFQDDALVPSWKDENNYDETMSAMLDVRKQVADELPERDRPAPPKLELNMPQAPRRQQEQKKSADPSVFVLPKGFDGYNATESEARYHVVKHLFDTIPELREAVDERDAVARIKRILLDKNPKIKGSGYRIELSKDGTEARQDDPLAGLFIQVVRPAATFGGMEIKISNFRDDIVKLYKERIENGAGPIVDATPNKDFSNVVEDGDRVRFKDRETGKAQDFLVEHVINGKPFIRMSDGKGGFLPDHEKYDFEILEKGPSKKRPHPYHNPYEAKLPSGVDFAMERYRGAVEMWNGSKTIKINGVTANSVMNDHEYVIEGQDEKMTLKAAMEEAARILNGEKVDKKPAATPAQQIADELKVMLRDGKDIAAADLFRISDNVYKGTRAAGRYTPKDAYDALELAVNQFLLEQQYDSEKKVGIDLTTRAAQFAKLNVRKLMKLTDSLPTQTNRTEDQEKFQQFSTPPAIAYVASWVSGVSANDVVLEPSAGIGGLALFGKANGAQVVVNELDERRLELLKQMPFDRFFKEDGEQINNILPDDVKPTVVLMNPPFSSAANRGVTKDTTVSFKHVEQALKRLEDGGRLVAILGAGRDGLNSKQFNDWIRGLRKNYNVRATLSIDGKNYAKYGTTFSVQYVVIDKTGATPEGPIAVSDHVSTIAEAIDKLEGIANDRPATNPAAQPAAGESTGAARPEAKDGGQSKPSASGAASRSGDSRGDGGVSAGRPAGDGGRTAGAPEPAGAGTEPVANDEGTDGDGGRGSVVDGGDVQGADDGRSDGDVGQLDREEDRSGRDSKPGNVKKQLSDSIFEDYTPRKLKVKGAKKHPGTLAESAAMSAIDPPEVTYKPAIPAEVIESGRLSDAQLEAITYAGQAHNTMLPDEKTRRGFFIGDGTGVGKGREISGIILDNFMQGRTKAVWITENDGLLPSARRDWSDVSGRDPEEIFVAPKVGKAIEQKNGILFSKYTTIGNSDERLNQLVDWLGADFDGVIAFDEAHNMANSVAQKGKRGTKKASKRALAGIELQQKLPNARIVYVSATGATEVSNLAYAERLGLWGAGTPFGSAHDFVSKISDGGIAAMELVARDMKALGLYIARSLSYNGVQYEKLAHNLSKDQREVYTTLARSWQVVLQNINEALEIIGVSDAETGKAKDGMAKGRVIGQFWGAQQRFFNQVLTAMQMPTIISEVRKDLDAGRSVVLQLVNTNEATQERGISKMEEEGGDLEDLDLSPRDIIIQFVDKTFPVIQQEEFEDDSGNVRVRDVLDSEGNPVINREAQAMKEDLLRELETMPVPNGVIEQVLDTFGVEDVAEITGRGRRIVMKEDEESGMMKRVLENRGKDAGEADATAFMSGKKRVLIFSNAGGTGRSYHADRTKKNQQQRVHYLVQPGWEATKAVQGFGRTHRTNQASAPIYKLITTDLKGQMRFVSSIARRLDQLGALTKGQRQTGSQGFFKSSDNLEGWVAQDSLEMFYAALANNQIEGLDRGEVLTKMGLQDKILDGYGNFNREADEVKDITKFLNRLLVLEPALQNRVFDTFQRYLEAVTQQAEEKGLIDTGLENYKADSVKAIDEQEIRRDPVNGSTTTYHELEVGHRTEPVKLSELKKYDGFLGVYVNEASKSVRVMLERPSKTDEAGRIVKRFYLQGPERTEGRTIDENELKKSNWKKIEDDAEAKNVWSEAIDNLPEFRTEKLHLISGTLLPIWDRLPQSRTRVIRVALDDGSVLLGRVLPPSTVGETLRRLGAESRSKGQDFTALAGEILDGATAKFANGWKLERRRVGGENRIEIIPGSGPALYRHSSTLQNLGMFTEKIGSEYRYFIPTGSDSLAKIAKLYPISEVTAPPAPPKTEKKPAAAGPLLTVKPDKNTKTGEDIWVATMNRRLSNEEYDAVKRQIQQLGGYYSSFKKGFIFGEDPGKKIEGVTTDGYKGATAEDRAAYDINAEKDGGVGIVPRAFSQPRKSPKTYTPPNDPYAIPDPNSEKMFQEARREKPALMQKIGEAFAAVRRKMREFEHLPKLPAYEKLRQKLLQLINGPDAAKFRTYQIILQSITKDLSRPDFNLFRRKVVADDMFQALQRGESLGFEMSENVFYEWYNTLNEGVDNNPVVKKALAKRREHWDEIKENYFKAMGDIGFDVRDRVAREDYFRHQVLEYANQINKGEGVRKLRTPEGRGFLKGRTGEYTGAYNTDYLVAEAEVMIQMLYDTEKAKVIKLVDREHNIAQRLKEEAKAHNFAALDRLFTREKMAPNAPRDALGEAVSESEEFYKTFAVKMARAFSELNAMKPETMWDGENGEWADVVANLTTKRAKKSDIDALNEDEVAGGMHSRVFDYFRALAGQDGESGVIQARTILKAVSDRREFVKKSLGKEYVDTSTGIPDRFVPTGYKKWQPREGSVFFKKDVASATNDLFMNLMGTFGIDQNMMNEMISRLNKAIGKPMLTIGGRRREFVIPQEVADTLDSIMEDHISKIAVVRVIRAATRVFKIAVLTGPRSLIKYNLRNTTSDADKTLAGNPGAFRKVYQATAELSSLYFKETAGTPELREFVKRGGLQTLQQVQEVGNVDHLKMFKRFYEKEKGLTPKVKNSWNFYWRSARKVTDFREAIFRYANYLAYLEQIGKSPEGRPENFGSSRRELVMALDDPRDRAFKLANELLVDYRSTSTIGRELSDTGLYAFFRWVEGNLKSTSMLMVNAYKDGKAAETIGRKIIGKTGVTALYVGRAALHLSLFAIMIHLWNHLVFPDEEKELPEDVRSKMHIIFGRDPDGKIRYLDRLGFIEDYLEWFGVDNLLTDVREVLDGRKTLEEWANETWKKPLNKLFQGIGPVYKAPFEMMTGQSFFPDAFNPSGNNEWYEPLLNAVNIRKDFEAIVGYFSEKPNRPTTTIGNALDFASSGSDPEEAAYYDIRDLAARYKKRNGIGGGSAGDPNEKSQALYYYKLAVRYDDVEAQQRFLEKYAEEGGTRQGLNQSLRAMHPLGGMSQGHQRLFYQGLSDADKEKYEIAVNFYRNVLLGAGE